MGNLSSVYIFHISFDLQVLIMEYHLLHTFPALQSDMSSKNENTRSKTKKYKNKINQELIYSEVFESNDPFSDVPLGASMTGLFHNDESSHERTFIVCSS